MAQETRGWKYRLAVRGDLDPSADESYSDLDPDWDDAGHTTEFYFPSVCTLNEIQGHVFVPGTRGTRDIFPDQTVRGNRVAGGRLQIKFGRDDLDKWLPRILGAAESADSFKVGDILPRFQGLVDKGQSQFFEYRDGKVARAEFAGSVGSIVSLSLDCIFTKEEVYAGSWPAKDFPTDGQLGDVGTRPLRMAEGGFTLDSTTLNFESFRLVIDNQLDPTWYAGDDSLACIDELQRGVSLFIPFAHNAASKSFYSRGFEGLQGVLTFSGDNMSTVATMPKLFWDKRTTEMIDEGKTPLELGMRAYRTQAGDSGADDSITFTNDPVHES